MNSFSLSPCLTKVPVPSVVSLLHPKELARHNNGNQTPNQTYPPRAPSPCLRVCQAAGSPMGLVSAWLEFTRRVLLTLSPPHPPRPEPASEAP